eukprot:2640026-Alexandrium_andersonii.AAC.1
MTGTLQGRARDGLRTIGGRSEMSGDRCAERGVGGTGVKATGSGSKQRGGRRSIGKGREAGGFKEEHAHPHFVDHNWWRGLPACRGDSVAT